MKFSISKRLLKRIIDLKIKSGPRCEECELKAKRDSARAVRAYEMYRPQTQYGRLFSITR